MHVLLQVMVQILIGIDFRGIRRGMEYLNVTLVIIQPFLDNFSVMNSQVINDKQDFPIRVLHELSHEINETLLGHVFLIAHEAAAPPAAYRRNHVYLLDFRKGRDDGRLAPDGESADIILLIVYASLVAPVYIGLLGLCLPGDFRVCLLHELLELLGILPVSPLCRTLTCHSPSLKVV